MTVLALAVTACEWTEPENLDYIRKPVEQQEGYDAYLERLRAFKKTDHKIMILTMEGTSEYPVLQSQHLMSMPDSADYICMKNVAGLHEQIVSEISEVREKKGTRVISYVDFGVASSDWQTLKNNRMDAGEPEPTLEECREFFRSSAETQLAYCDEFGFEGIMVSFESNNSGDENRTAQESFMSAVKEWKAAHADHLMFMRGNIMNITDVDLRNQSEYYVIVLGGGSGAVKYKAVIRSVMRDVEKRDGVVFEVIVPSKEEPDQTGDSPRDAANVILSDQMADTDFTTVGISVSNAHDDYYNETFYADDDINRENPIQFGNYVNIRRAFPVLNPPADGQEPEEGTVTE